MAGLSLYGRDQMLSAFFIPDAFDSPESVWVALTLLVPTVGDTGDDLSEPDDGTYARRQYLVGGTAVDGTVPGGWSLTGRGGVSNLMEIDFGVPAVDWGDVVGWALCSQQWGGQTYYVGELTNPMRVLANTTGDPANDVSIVAGVGALVVKQT